jgi:hypothetical protein
LGALVGSKATGPCCASTRCYCFIGHIQGGSRYLCIWKEGVDCTHCSCLPSPKNLCLAVPACMHIPVILGFTLELHKARKTYLQMQMQMQMQIYLESKHDHSCIRDDDAKGAKTQRRSSLTDWWVGKGTCSSALCSCFPVKRLQEHPPSHCACSHSPCNSQ